MAEENKLKIKRKKKEEKNNEDKKEMWSRLKELKKGFKDIHEHKKKGKKCQKQFLRCK